MTEETQTFNPDLGPSYEEKETVSLEDDIELSEDDFLSEVDLPEDKPKDVTEEKQEAAVIRKPNALLEDAYDSPSDAKSVKGVGLPSLPLEEFTESIGRFASVADNMAEMLVDWRATLQEAVEFFTPAGHMQDRFSDPDSSFRQGVENDGGRKSISPLNFKRTEGELKGEMALLKVSKFLGLGEVVNVPLPHSGIWVTIKPPTEKDLIDFYNMIFREKVTLGRATSGYTLTNMSVHINNRLYEFILRHIHSVNYEDISKEDLKDKILIHDFPILAWGFACSMYPSGFDYERACMNDIEECTHIAQAKLNLSKLLWIDNSSLTTIQKNILSENRPNRLKMESYSKYQVEHERTVAGSITTKQGIKFKLRIPTFAEYTSDGLKWVNSITNIVERALIDTETDEDTKLDTLNQYVRASILRQYNGFIDYIEIDGSTINDRPTIDDMLGMFSSDDGIREELTKGIIEFKSKTSIAIIGIPEYKCPACGTEQKLEDPGTSVTNVIPLDVMNMFFLTLTSRISKILEREV